MSLCVDMMYVLGVGVVFLWCFFFFKAEDGIRDLVRSRGLGDVYKRQDQRRDQRRRLDLAIRRSGIGRRVRESAVAEFYPRGRIVDLGRAGGAGASGHENTPLKNPRNLVPDGILDDGNRPGAGRYRTDKSAISNGQILNTRLIACLLYTSPSPRDRTRYRMPSSA